jgi:hypothetical protein
MSEKQVYTMRQSELTPSEASLIGSINIDQSYFFEVFRDVLISEILCNSRMKGQHRDSISGVIFCGKKIELEKVLQLRKEFGKLGLILEVSVDEMINRRYNEFSFPVFSDKKLLLDIDKNYYKIYPKKDRLNFIDQVSYVRDDKPELIEFYNIIVNKFNGFPIWADGEENLLYLPESYSDELVEAIYQFNDSAYPKGPGIEKGWYTKESLLKGYKDRLPLVDLGFYE